MESETFYRIPEIPEDMHIDKKIKITLSP